MSQDSNCIAIERQIYERFARRGGHNGVLSNHGVVEDGIRLQHAVNHDLKSFLGKEQGEALGFVHEARVMHGDVTSANIFLDDDLNPELADSAGSSLDGSPLHVESAASYQYPGKRCQSADIFAFGSLAYEMMTGHEPYQGLRRRKSTAILRSEFPDTEPLGSRACHQKMLARGVRWMRCCTPRPAR
ncbi:Uncharacterized protein TPAR_05313 [Tolypocladium paradoxum]|uniref:EKC/KEOPS complex subunit BUD32 n=1 Tax=Tolypocladium paradoxum TaxID=94208 RepID=A0A2S4KWH0_9HYPO|nr:Uncharacterized protein TPAR_05313 [Tolypocladium paradoxum]